MTAAPWLVASATLFAMAPLAACSSYGASFDYPSAPPVPDGAKVIVNDNGWDDDDPIRSRVRIVDAQGSTVAAVVDFYRAAYSSQDGWRVVRSRDSQELCLVNTTSDEYTQVLDVSQYAGSRVAVQPDRHLVVISRIEQAYKRPCGAASIWLPADLT